MVRNPSPRKPGMPVKADPELLRQIRAAARAETPVEAVFTLRLPKRVGTGPKRVEDFARTILDRVAQTAGIGAIEVSVFANLGAFAVSAPPKFVRALLKEPEISSAVANRPLAAMPPKRHKRRR